MVLPIGVTPVTNIQGDEGPQGKTGTFATATAVSVPYGSPFRVIVNEEARSMRIEVPLPPPGPAGASGLVTDTAIATNLQTAGTDTQKAADGRFPRLAAVTEGALLGAVAAGSGVRVVATGHSLMYGQDTSATGTTAATNGATQTRSSKPTTEALRDQAKFTSAAPVVVVNQAYPGDQTADALTRWAAGESGDIEFFWLDTNDARNYGNRPRGPLTDGQTSTNLTALAQRARDRSASFVVIGGAPVLSRGDSHKIFASAQTDRAVAERYGATYVDVGELLSDYAANDEYWTDGVHWKPAAYSLIGARLAALLGPKGVNPPKAAPGRVFTWRDNVFVGGTNTTVDAPNVAGRVARLLNTEALALSFDATVPVIPVVRFRASAHAAVGLYSNLNTNRVPIYATVGSNAVLSGISVIQAPPVTSPGPAGLVIRAESGTVDVLSVEFIPATSTSAETLGPLGGKQQRASDSWDGAVAWRAARPTRSGIAQSAVKPASFLFDVTLGHSDSGVLLAEAIHETMPYLARDGYLLLRRGATLLVRRMNDGTATTLTTIADLFPAAGIVTTSIELSLTSAGAGLVTVAGTQVYTIETLGLSYGIPGLVAGPTSGNAFASGRVSSR